MNKLNRYACLAVLICLAAVQAPAQQNKNFKWSLALRNDKTGASVPFSTPVQAQTGEEFRLVVQPSARGFIYIIAESRGGEDVAVLYAGQMKNGDTWYSDILKLTAPQGSESLFIVASADEQKTLAQRITAFNESNGVSQKRALMNEIFRIRSEASKFKEAPEKPVLMGGTARGSKDQGMEFSGLGTYVKTISIEH